jgi:peroxiredoxin
MATAPFFLAALLIAAAPDARRETPIGKQIAAFELDDYLGAKHSLADWKDKKALVVVFLGTECPLAKMYGPRLAELDKRYADKGVQIVGVNSNRQDTLAEIAHYARIHKIDFPILKDAGNRVADQFGAVRTPEAFLLDANRVVRYWGAIDDQYGIGYAKGKAAKEYLATAIDELLAGEEVTTPVVESVGCYIGRASRKEPSGDVTYSNQVARALNKHCVLCHRPNQIAPFALTSYDEVAPWAETIREVIEQGRMPPWHANPAHGKFYNDARMTDEEKRLVFQWIENGLPEGDKRDLPPPPQFAEGWRIPKPDIVIKMPEPYKVQAKGTVPYQYFVVDPGFKEDVWVRGAEGRPGNRSVVHHLVLFFVPPGQEGFRPEDPLFNAVAAYSPGMPAPVGPDEFARCIPAGSKLVFQMHYTPNGSEQTDQSEAGLVLADPKKVQKEVTLSAALNFQFRIPPGATDHRLEARTKFGQDTLLYTLIPHMHLRGKSFRFTAIYPDQREEILLDVPRYDFNWQNIYMLAEPKRIPEGTELVCVAHFDNSADNLMNPDPTKTVYWGDQTWEEMMVGSFSMSLAEQDLRLGPPQVKPRGDGKYDVRFLYKPARPVSAVYLAGEFNEWKPDGLTMDGPDGEGFFSKTLALDKGRYEYKFVLDGKTWRHDPGNREQSGFYKNSVAWVGTNAAEQAQEKGAEKNDEKKGQAKPKFTISKETTYITEPLTEEGYPNYAAALNKHYGKGVTPENNAAVLFWKAYGPHPEGATMPPDFFRLLGVELPEEGEYFLVYTKFLTEHKQIPRSDERFAALNEQQLEAAKRPWKRDEFPEIAEWLAANEKPLAVVVEGTRRTECFSPVVLPKKQAEEDFGLMRVRLPGVQQSREFARALAARAMLRLGEGKVEEARQDLLACHRLGRLVAQGPFLIEFLVGIAIDGIAARGDLAFIEHTSPNAGQAARYLRELDALPRVAHVGQRVDLAERMIFLDLTLIVARDGLAAISRLTGKQIPQGLANVTASIEWDGALRAGNEWYDRLAAALDEPSRAERAKKLAAIEADLKKLTSEAKGLAALAVFSGDGGISTEAAGKAIGQVLIALVGNVTTFHDAGDRAQQQQANLRVALALSAYRADQGRYPDKLAELSPKYLKEVPADLFTGQPLIYHVTEDGYLFYSVGVDGKDDGGLTYGEDIRVRMPAGK